jgi:hypothetical protein
MQRAERSDAGCHRFPSPLGGEAVATEHGEVPRVVRSWELGGHRLGGAVVAARAGSGSPEGWSPSRRRTARSAASLKPPFEGGWGVRQKQTMACRPGRGQPGGRSPPHRAATPYAAAAALTGPAAGAVTDNLP